MTPRIYAIDDVLDLRVALDIAEGNRSFYFVTRTGEVVCQDHVHDFQPDYEEAFEGKNLIDRTNRLMGYAVNRDDYNLVCGVTGIRIPVRWSEREARMVADYVSGGLGE